MWRFYNCMVILKLVWQNTVSCHGYRSVWWSEGWYDKTWCLVTGLQLFGVHKVSMKRHGVLWRLYNCMVILKLVWQNTCLVTALQLYGDPQVSVTKHGVLWRLYNSMVILKLVWQNTCLSTFYSCLVVIKLVTKHGVLWRVYNCLVVIKLVWQNTVSCDGSTTVWWS